MQVRCLPWAPNENSMEENIFAQNIQRYKNSKELSSGLLTAYAIYSARSEFPNPRPGSRDTLEGLNETERTEVAVAVRDINQLARKFEVVRWMTIQKAINDYNSGIAGYSSDFKVLALATAGRLLITVSDSKPQGQGKFGGAWISLIGQDDNPGHMGVQGLCATKEEALGLLNAAVDDMPELTRSNEVGII
jgi:hypothetical protein